MFRLPIFFLEIDSNSSVILIHVSQEGHSKLINCRLPLVFIICF